MSTTNLHTVLAPVSGNPVAGTFAVKVPATFVGRRSGATTATAVFSVLATAVAHAQAPFTIGPVTAAPGIDGLGHAHRARHGPATRARPSRSASSTARSRGRCWR